MPAPVLSYIKGILQGYRITATYLSRQFGFSHDRLTRGLHRKFSWKQYWYRLTKLLFGLLHGGFFILDDTVIAKPFGKLFPGGSVVWDSSKERPVFGYNLVFLCWSNGIFTLPLAWKWYKKDGKSKTMLAQALLKHAKDTLRLKPESVLFDSWYASQDILNQLTDYGWYFVTRLKKNRIINGCKISQDLVENQDQLVGLLTGKCQVKVFKNEDRYLATNRIDLTPLEILVWYTKRWKIEDLFRFLKDQLHLEQCQARTKTAQKTHLFSCLIAYLVMVKQQQAKPHLTLYRLKESWLHSKPFSRCQWQHFSQVLMRA